MAKTSQETKIAPRIPQKSTAAAKINAQPETKVTEPTPPKKAKAKASSPKKNSSQALHDQKDELEVKPRQLSASEKKFVEKQTQRLLELRDHFLDQMQGVAQDNLRSRPEGSESSAFGMHQADAGSDAYERDFALSLLSQEQDALYEIEEALKRVENDTYGVCEMSGKIIPHARLEAIPFARFTIECQQQLEKENRGKRRWETTPQFMDSSENFSDDDDDTPDDVSS